MNLELGPRLKQVPVVTRREQEVELSGGTPTRLSQGKVKDSTVIFSISFGPKLIEVKTLISNSCTALKYHAVKRNRVIWEELGVNEGFRENQKKVGLGFFHS